MLVAGYDPGIGGSAITFGQEDLEGRLFILGEITTAGVGASRFMSERLKPYLNRRFPDLRPEMFLIAPDPAANNRSANDESTIVAQIKRHFPVSIETNNRLPLRLDAIDHYATRMVAGQPSLLIDEQACPQLVRALKGGWRYTLDSKEQIKGGGNAAPEKGPLSHVGDSFGYTCRWFHRQGEKSARYGPGGIKAFAIPKFANRYHFR